jgi:hypothetical protein
MHWVAKDARGKGLGVQQLETLSQSLSKDKTTLLSSEEMSPSAEGAWSKFQKQYPDAVTKTDKGYSVDLRKMRGEELPPVGGGSQAGESRTRIPDEDTSFNPEKFRTQTNEPVMEKPGKKKSPMKKMNV